MKDILENGIIELLASQSSAPMALVQRKDGSLGLCLDYYRLNSVNAYPMPRMDELLDHLGKAHFTSTMDLNKAIGRYQLVAVKDRHMTAF